MLRFYFQGQNRPGWPVLAAFAVLGVLAVLLVLAAALVGAVLFIPLALIGAVGCGVRRLVTRAGRLRDDGRSNVRVIPRDEI